tara:strand:+ start:1406 stop:1639 length:234 start_codon:yes stop_codon:yes gene_type:complete
MRLSKKIRITQEFVGKSSDPFWQLIRFDDILEVSASIGWTGKYAMTASVKNLTSGDKTQVTGGRFVKYMEKLTYDDA